MARLSFFRFSVLSLSTIAKSKLENILNIAIFISIFALSASALSIYFENKVDQIETKIIEQDTHHIVYNNWLTKTPRNIKNIEKILDKHLERSYYNYVINQQDTARKLIHERAMYYEPYWNYKRTIETSMTEIESVLSDAILVASSEKDLKSIILYRNKATSLKKMYFKHVEDFWLHQDEFLYLLHEQKGQDDYKYYIKFSEFESDLQNILNEQKKFNINFNLSYFTKKRDEYLKNIEKYQNEIKKFSKLEIRFILVAFFIQLFIFFVSQYFEFTIDMVRGRKK